MSMMRNATLREAPNYLHKWKYLRFVPSPTRKDNINATRFISDITRPWSYYYGRRLCYSTSLSRCSPCKTSLSSILTQCHHNDSETRYLIHWRGEHKEKYSGSFRHWEFLSSLSATIADSSGMCASVVFNHLNDRAMFTNAFTYNPRRNGQQLPASVSLCQVEMYNQALQYVNFTTDSSGTNSSRICNEITSENILSATARCSLIHATFLVLADGTSYPELVERSLLSRIIEDTMQEYGAKATTKTWRVRRHEFSFVDDDNNPRFGKESTRSVTKERGVLPHLEPILTQFGGKVDLKDPDCDIYLFEGLSDNEEGIDYLKVSSRHSLFKILCRKLTQGASHSAMAPKTRRMRTNTPLCSISAYLLCNIARIQKHQTILDPFAGSAATLLAASLISPTVRVVGIEIATDEFLPRDDVRMDFTARGVTEPVSLLEGNVMDRKTRDNAREVIGEDASFDVIITDPPYGRREAMSGGGVSVAALNDLIDVIGYDRKRGMPILRPDGGQLVAFLPCPKECEIQDLLPSEERLAAAGLQLQKKREQRLNNAISRWVLSFSSI
mmetsp:Transcript_25761/g.53815  ORF Transcript_25761/g.53815 Transcript_25761/m.53815 type:complete len:556 (-) Transcript_25761:190-1857(-)